MPSPHGRAGGRRPSPRDGRASGARRPRGSCTTPAAGRRPGTAPRPPGERRLELRCRDLRVGRNDEEPSFELALRDGIAVGPLVEEAPQAGRPGYARSRVTHVGVTQRRQVDEPVDDRLLDHAVEAPTVLGGEAHHSHRERGDRDAVPPPGDDEVGSAHPCERRADPSGSGDRHLDAARPHALEPPEHAGPRPETTAPGTTSEAAIARWCQVWGWPGSANTRVASRRIHRAAATRRSARAYTARRSTVARARSWWRANAPYWRRARRSTTRSSSCTHGREPRG